MNILATLKLITATGSAILTSEVSGGLALEAAGPGAATGSCTLSCAEPITTGEVVIVPDKQVYTVKPESDVELSFDLTAVADNEVSFLLLLDMDSDVSVTFPENVLWSDAAPALAKGYIHCIELTYIPSTVYSGFRTKYLGKINKPLDLTKGFVVYQNTGDPFDDADLTLMEDMYRIGYVAEPITMNIEAYGDHDDQYHVFVNPGVTLSSLTVNGSLSDDSVPVTVQGGRIEQLCLNSRAAIKMTSGTIDYAKLATRDESMCYCQFTMSGGTIGTLKANTDTSTRGFTGGYIDSVLVESYYAERPVSFDLAGGTIGTVTLTCASSTLDPVYYTQSAGYCDKIIQPGRSIFGGDITVTGGSVGSIELGNYYPDNYRGTTVSLTSCSVDSLTAYIAEGSIWVNPTIKLNSNAVVGRLDIIAEGVPPDEVHELLIGPGCTVGLGASVSQAEALGAITLNIDSTAVVTNLED